MKTLLAFVFSFCFAMSGVFSQDSLEVIQLKNGETYRGRIVAKHPGEDVELRVGRHNVLVFQEDEIESISTEQIQVAADSLAKYGGYFSVGAAIGGGGLLGMSLRLKDKATSFEFGTFYRPFLIHKDGNYQIKGALLLSASLSIGITNQYKAIKQKVVSNGIYIKGGIGLGNYKQSILGFGWMSERFRQNDKTFSFTSELGPGLVIHHWVDDYIPLSGIDIKNKLGLILAWKIQWNSYSK